MKITIIINVNQIMILTYRDMQRVRIRECRQGIHGLLDNE